MDPVPAAVAGAGLHRPPVYGDPFAHPEQAEAAQGGRPGGGSVVGNVDFDEPALAAQRYLHLVRAGVLEHVRQAFLDDAVRRQVQTAGNGGQVTVRAHIYLDAGLTNLGH
jgi:hypothetical protein